MAILKTVYEVATGKPIYEGFGADPSEEGPGCGVIETELPAFEEAQALPVCGIQFLWIMDGERVLKENYSHSKFSCDGLTATLGAGHIFGDVHAEVTEADSYTFAQPEAEVALALDAALDELGQPQLQPYQWFPAAEPAETKGDLPTGWTLVKADLLRGILPAGSRSLADLQEEE